MNIDIDEVYLKALGIIVYIITAAIGISISATLFSDPVNAIMGFGIFIAAVTGLLYIAANSS